MARLVCVVFVPMNILSIMSIFTCGQRILLGNKKVTINTGCMGNIGNITVADELISNSVGHRQATLICG